MVISGQRGGAIHVEYPLTGLDIIFDFSYISIHVGFFPFVFFLSFFSCMCTFSYPPLVQSQACVRMFALRMKTTLKGVEVSRWRGRCV